MTWLLMWLGHQQPWFSLFNFNPSSPSVAYKHQWNGSSLIYIMACCLFGARPVSKAMLTSHQFNLKDQTSMKNLPIFFDKIVLPSSICNFAAILSWANEFLHCGLVMPYGDTQVHKWVNIGSDNGLTLTAPSHNLNQCWFLISDPDSKVHGANIGPIWGRQDPGGPHVGPMNFAIWGGSVAFFWEQLYSEFSSYYSVYWYWK